MLLFILRAAADRRGGGSLSSISVPFTSQSINTVCTHVYYFRVHVWRSVLYNLSRLRLKNLNFDISFPIHVVIYDNV